MNILGVHGSFGRSDHDTAAALVVDGRLLAAAEEERFIRRKHAVGVMPENAIRYCLKECGLSMKEIDLVAFPRATWKDVTSRLRSFITFRFGYCPPVELVDHHLAHAASAFFTSRLDHSLVLTNDRAGDRVALAVFRADSTGVSCVHREPFPNSLGLFTSLVTQYLGFSSNNDEYKVMGLAAHGTPNVDLRDILVVDTGGYSLEQKWINPQVQQKYPYFSHEQLPLFSDAFDRRFRCRRLIDDPITPLHANLAASAQRMLEKAVLAVLQRHRCQSDENLCLAGGVAQNTAANGRIAASGLFGRLYVPPAPTDAGSAAGAALYTADASGETASNSRTSFLGPGFSDDEIRRLLRSSDLAYQVVGDPSARAADLLAAEQTVGWFQGRAEFGPRALGNRSLLANPRRPETHERVNELKGREQFRPFAPAVLEEFGADYLSVNVDSPFMSFTVPTSDHGLALFPAATHVDGTARVQTVGRELGSFRRLIELFAERAGVAAVLNTSLNAGWEPIALTPAHALSYYYSSGLDALMLGSFLLQKRRNRRFAPRRAESTRVARVRA